MRRFNPPCESRYSNLSNAELNLAIAKIEKIDTTVVVFDPCSNWAQGGLIIEREKIALCFDVDGEYWEADKLETEDYERWTMVYGHTPLVAAMRCYAEFVAREEAAT